MTIDMSTAFDSVVNFNQHNRHPGYCSSIAGVIHVQIQIYQTICIGGHNSLGTLTESVIPQGSVLGPYSVLHLHFVLGGPSSGNITCNTTYMQITLSCTLISPERRMKKLQMQSIASSNASKKRGSVTTFSC